MDLSMALWVLCSATGMVLVVGILFLIWKGLIDLHMKERPAPTDAAHSVGGQGAGEQGEHPRPESKGGSTKISFLGFKMNTEFPVLIMFFLGFAMLIYPVYNAKNICPDLSLHRKTFPQMVQVTAKVKSPIPIDVYAIVAQQDKSRNDVILSIPFTKGTYRIMYSYNNEFHIQDPFLLNNTESQELRYIEVQASPVSTPEIAKETLADPKDVVVYK
jgi:hypothetical protein